MRTALRRAGLLAVGGALAAATALGFTGAASAAQGPHHHPTWEQHPTVQDAEITVYREAVGAKDRWCVANYHRVGALTNYRADWGTTKYGGRLTFPAGGGHVACTPLYDLGTQDVYHIEVEYQSVATHRYYSYEATYSNG